MANQHASRDAVSVAEAPVLNIVGERVALGPLRRDLLPLYHRWLNDLPTQRLSGHIEPLRPGSWEQAEMWYDRSANADHAMWFTVYAVDGWRAIGYANLRDVDFQHRTATFGLTIGEPSDRGKGFGTEATRLLMDQAFTALGLHNLWLDVFAFNEAGRRAYEKAGFREIGRRREAHAAGGRLWDVILMDALATEFHSPVLQRAFS